jgi:hypothetical protein
MSDYRDWRSLDPIPDPSLNEAGSADTPTTGRHNYKFSGALEDELRARFKDRPKDKAP